jgi:hypothetical protein
MKTLLALSAAFAMLAALPQDVHTQFKKYDVKSGIVTFENVIEMGTMKMKHKVMVYFDDYGMKECHDNYNGEKLDNSLMSDGKMEYVLHHKEKTVETRGTALRGTEFRFDWNEISEKDRTSGNAKKLPNVTVAGKNCESFMVGSPTELAQSREVRGEREGASREIRGSGRIRLEVIELRGEGGSRSGLFRKRRSRGMISDPEARSRILRFPDFLTPPCVSLHFLRNWSRCGHGVPLIAYQGYISARSLSSRRKSRSEAMSILRRQSGH